MATYLRYTHAISYERLSQLFLQVFGLDISQGAIALLTGKHFQHEYPKLNGEYFQQFLEWLSQQLGDDYGILQIDQAPAHTSSAIRWPENIIPLLQPPHSPGLAL